MHRLDADEGKEVGTDWYSAIKTRRAMPPDLSGKTSRQLSHHIVGSVCVFVSTGRATVRVLDGEQELCRRLAGPCSFLLRRQLAERSSEAVCRRVTVRSSQMSCDGSEQSSELSD